MKLKNVFKFVCNFEGPLRLSISQRLIKNAQHPQKIITGTGIINLA